MLTYLYFYRKKNGISQSSYGLFDAYWHGRRQDRRTMPLHFADFITKHTSYGVLIVPQDLLVAEAIDSIILIWSASDVEEWIDRIFYLPL